MSKKSILFIVGAVAVLFLMNAVFGPVNITKAANSPVTGYAWSDNIGWIQMNPAFGGVQLDDSTGIFSGYAWSDNIGWVDFAPASGYPEMPNEGAKLNLSTGQVTGWIKALSAANGWDGWIKMSGTSPAYGVSADLGTGVFSGYAWGSDVVGWVSFSGVTMNPNAPVCDNDGICEDGETFENCPNDCTIPPACNNNGTCEEGEDNSNCTNDCPLIPDSGEDFSLNISNAIFVSLVGGAPSVSSETMITISPQDPFASDVSLSVDSVNPALSGATYNFSDSSLSSPEYSTGTRFSVNVPAGTPSGLYTITIKGDGGGLIRTINVQLNIEAVEPSWIEI